MHKEKREHEWKLSVYVKESDTRVVLLAKRITFILMYKEAFFNTNDLDKSLPSVERIFLEEFEDVFLEEVPKGLPPIRRIEHQIDLIPGVQIPNRPAYKSNPK